MIVPFVDLKMQYQNIKDEVNAEIHEVLESCAYILGPKVEEFEQQFAIMHQAKYCLANSTGTDSLHLAMMALEVGPGDEVLVPVNTFFATAEAVSLAGAKPVFVDCEADYYNIDAAKIEQAITNRTKGIIPVHLYGQSADMAMILQIAEKHKLWVVEDACQAHCAEYQNRRVGAMGIIGCFSFYPGKNLGAYGEGGAVLTNDEQLYEKMKKLRDHGSSKKYNHELVGHNYRMEGIQGAVLSVKLRYIEQWTEQRRKNAALYSNLLSDIPEVVVPKEMESVRHVYHLYVVQVPKRNELQNFLSQNGISTGLHYPVPLHLQQAYKSLGYKKGDFQIAETQMDKILSLPMYPELTSAQIQYVVSKIKEFYLTNHAV
ncbi:MAG: DegT/DnrJ/EryC1/StrS family aminotransferase [Nitrospirae bacterium]|nr:DegT/DnrJ/EryC1/StrS family aminotransferase [Nitrospirota bacterium]